MNLDGILRRFRISTTSKTAVDNGPVWEMDIRGPVFISYRHSDGGEYAQRVARRLRALGLPVWLDSRDMLLGSFEHRMTEALAAGPSAGILIVTEDVKLSEAILTTEYPGLAKLARDHGLTLGIVNTITTDSGDMDQDAPNRIYPDIDGVELTRYHQVSVDDDEGLLTLGRLLVRERIKRLRPEISDRGELRISIQTRNTAQSDDRTRGDLDIRLPGEPGQALSHAALRDFAANLPSLRDVTTTAQARAIQIDGGGHLSVMLALGAMLPAARIPAMTFVQPNGERWHSDSTVAAPATPPFAEVTTLPGVTSANPSRVLVAVAMLPTSDSSAVDALVADPAGWASAYLIRPTRSGPLDFAQAQELANDVAAHLRSIGYAHPGAVVHLAYGGPAPLAVLIGRLTNTLTITAYDWTRPTDGPPRYVPTLTFCAGPAARIEPVDEVPASG